jgi:hypothetical protein
MIVVPEFTSPADCQPGPLDLGVNEQIAAGREVLCRLDHGAAQVERHRWQRRICVGSLAKRLGLVHDFAAVKLAMLDVRIVIARKPPIPRVAGLLDHKS